ncbi:hypothetical protein TNIN_277031 [Trichonephila inaurata madagascariensis]|uniref:Uncharacterized protein n=1 Tax=Trichonephila inaurata madagascariensis TaxID=2747483 RepID=A0A8X7BN71_9ARAC|nr:hypothetical protein TNIN_277031 [Trichonephila inaurata madagascariensis]
MWASCGLEITSPQEPLDILGETTNCDRFRRRDRELLFRIVFNRTNYEGRGFRVQNTFLTHAVVLEGTHSRWKLLSAGPQTSAGLRGNSIYQTTRGMREGFASRAEVVRISMSPAGGTGNGRRAIPLWVC